MIGVFQLPSLLFGQFPLQIVQYRGLPLMMGGRLPRQQIRFLLLLAQAFVYRFDLRCLPDQHLLQASKLRRNDLM
jgi:hypothetical protein